MSNNGANNPAGSGDNSANPNRSALVAVPESHSSASQPRHPRNLQGLLRFATELTRNEDPEAHAPVVPMDEERRKFLEEAINNLRLDPTSEMLACIDILSNTETIADINCDSNVPNNVVNAFDTLFDIISNLDMSIGFYKLDGYKIFPVCFSCENAEVRSQACQLLAEICQNNPICQSKAHECGFLHTVLDIIKSEDIDKVVKSALYAASCVVRDHERCTQTFIKEGGCEALMKCLQSDVDALRNKSAFLLCHIYPNFKELKEKAVEFIGALSIGLQKIKEDNPGHLLNALRIIIVSFKNTSEENLQSTSDEVAVHIKESVERHMRFCLADVGTYMEEIDNCKEILKRINSRVNIKQTTSSNAVDLDR